MKLCFVFVVAVLFRSLFIFFGFFFSVLLLVFVVEVFCLFFSHLKLNLRLFFSLGRALLYIVYLYPKFSFYRML